MCLTCYMFVKSVEKLIFFFFYYFQAQANENFELYFCVFLQVEKSFFKDNKIDVNFRS